MDIDPCVHEALRGSPGSVVALESTIITHGMPYPHNLETALEVEQIVRQKVGSAEEDAVFAGGRKFSLEIIILHTFRSRAFGIEY